MVTIKEKLIGDTDKIKEMNQSKPLKKSLNQKGRDQRRQKEHRRTTKQPETINKMAISTYLSITNLNVNGLNSLIKRQSG